MKAPFIAASSSFLLLCAHTENNTLSNFYHDKFLTASTRLCIGESMAKQSKNFRIFVKIVYTYL